VRPLKPWENGSAGKEVEVEGHGDPTLKRTGRLCGGLLQDIKRKVPHYLSDVTDAFNSQCLATFFFMYFALLAPIVTFGGGSLVDASTLIDCRSARGGHPPAHGRHGEPGRRLPLRLHVPSVQRAAVDDHRLDGPGARLRDDHIRPVRVRALPQA